MAYGDDIQPLVCDNGTGMVKDVEIDEEVDVIVSVWMGYMLLYEVKSYHKATAMLVRNHGVYIGVDYWISAKTFYWI
ncbi:Hypothetical predicted protein [Olea europaea subsp. europaea]|uniref:Uncharacterized protein n=1 Tax=Olea europaea subsp. europaea TaxID=158383 RepID=A0A8S0RN71_OLEEU|nr:Hypothetical predicted protein [Olea europaea subsp. europaea]